MYRAPLGSQERPTHPLIGPRPLKQAPVACDGRNPFSDPAGPCPKKRKLGLRKRARRGSALRFREGAVMPDIVSKCLDQVTRYAGGLERQHWVLISVVVLGLGMLCMRGFGSRNSY